MENDMQADESISWRRWPRAMEAAAAVGRVEGTPPQPASTWRVYASWNPVGVTTSPSFQTLPEVGGAVQRAITSFMKRLASSRTPPDHRQRLGGRRPSCSRQGARSARCSRRIRCRGGVRSSQPRLEATAAPSRPQGGPSAAGPWVERPKPPSGAADGSGMAGPSTCRPPPSVRRGRLLAAARFGLAGAPRRHLAPARAGRTRRRRQAGAAQTADGGRAHRRRRAGPVVRAAPDLRATFGGPRARREVRAGWSALARPAARRRGVDEAIEAVLAGYRTLDNTNQANHVIVDTEEDGLRLLRRELKALTFLRALHSRRQLHEVMVDFWTNHFNVFPTTRAMSTSDRRQPHRGPWPIGQAASPTCCQPAPSPAMLVYLDNARSNANSADGVNENWGGAARAHTLSIIDGEHVYPRPTSSGVAKGDVGLVGQHHR